MNILKKLAGETVLYGLPSILGRSINFLLVLLHTYAFAPAESGILTELYLYVAFLNIIYTYGMETSYFRFANQFDSKYYYNLILTSIIFTSFVFSTLIIFSSSSIARLLHYPGIEMYIAWLALVVAIDAIVAIPFARLRFEKKAKWFAIVRMANIFLNVGLNLFFLIFCKDIYEGKYLPILKPFINYIYYPSLRLGYVFLANLLANLAFLPLLFKQFLDFKFQFNFNKLKPVLIYAYPILIMGLAGVLNLMFDRIALKYLLPEGFYPKYTSQEALGIYGSCYKLSVFMSLVVQAFRYAAEPFFFSQAKEKNSPAMFAEVMKWFVIVCCILWVVVSINIDWIGNVFLRRASYRDGLAVVPVLLLGNLFLGVYYNLTVWFKLTDKTIYGIYFTFGGAFINIILNVLLIPIMGFQGCAVAFTVSCISMTLACYILGEQKFPIPYPIKKILAYLISANVLIIIALKIKFENIFFGTLLHILLCTIFAAIIYIMEFYFRKKKLNNIKTA